ncbi:MAG: hypothetical protein J5895_01235 [Alphaproteobacteria bacterium]|nr:hypothetical protein [Alphaproteobacteria bacterium]
MEKKNFEAFGNSTSDSFFSWVRFEKRMTFKMMRKETQNTKMILLKTFL